MSGCAAVDVDPEEGDVPCRQEAPYRAQAWSEAAGSESIPCCGHHACLAIERGLVVLGPSGHQVFAHADGDLYEVSL